MSNLIVLSCTFITLLISLSMFFISTDKKIGLLFVSFMTLTCLKMVYVAASDFIVITFCFSEYKHVKIYIKRLLENKTLKRVFLLILVMIILDYCFSPHLYSIYDSVRYIDLFIIRKYLLLFIAFVAIRNYDGLMCVVRYSIIAMFILTFFGIINLILMKSDFVSALLSVNADSVLWSNGEAYMYSQRFRVQAMFSNPFDYGFICCMCLFLYIYVRKQIGKKLFVILCACCIFGIITCMCRTVIICAVIGFLIYFFIVYRFIRFAKIICFMITMLVISYFFIPSIKDKLNIVSTVFTDDQAIGGSSISMRTVQFTTVLKYIEDQPLFGKGVNYFRNDLGWHNDNKEYMDRDLFGLEGVYLNRLLEHGWIGYILYLCVWFSLLYYFVKTVNKEKKTSALGISIWSQYFCFAHSTGELLAPASTLILLGCLIGIIYNNKKLVFNI